MRGARVGHPKALQVAPFQTTRGCSQGLRLQENAASGSRCEPFPPGHLQRLVSHPRERGIEKILFLFFFVCIYKIFPLNDTPE